MVYQIFFKIIISSIFLLTPFIDHRSVTEKYREILAKLPNRNEVLAHLLSVSSEIF